jgi:hypothetical protein
MRLLLVMLVVMLVKLQLLSSKVRVGHPHSRGQRQLVHGSEGAQQQPQQQV